MPGGSCSRLLQALVDELAREVDVGAVLEDDRHLGEPVARERARVLEARQPAHRGLDRERDALLDFERRVARRRGVDLHLDVGDVGHRVDRQAREIQCAESGHGEDADHHQPALTDREGEDAVNHCRPLLRALRQFRLYDKTVLRRVDIAFQHTKRDLHELRIALADLDVAGLELLAVADKDDGAVLDDLQRRGFYRDRHPFCRQHQPAADEQSGPQPLFGIRHDRSCHRALGVAAADRRKVGNCRLDRRLAVRGINREPDRRHGPASGRAGRRRNRPIRSRGPR